MDVLVELPHISCKNLAEEEHIRHYLQESYKYLTLQANLFDSDRSDISRKLRRFLQDSWADLVRHCLKIERHSA